uniref:80 kDa MCM3-associated protein n=1 Tax=Lygus hesperus TaxID=30085 RepID=A0A0A9WKW3_LYGHE
MRINLEKNKSSTGKQSTKGVCPDMCPEKERILRDVRGIVALHEAFPDTNVMDHSRAVKEYARSSADQDEPLPHELRPVPVLRMTMDYLISEIICRLDNNEGENKGNWYDFCWGRLRAIRKDIIQQQFCDINTVTIVEECARFHICCFDRLWGSPKSVFDDKINSETLMNCLQSLMYMYKDLRKQGKSCPNEAEFRAYMVLLKLHSGFVLSEFQQFPLELQKSTRVREAVDIHTAYNNNMYSTYFMLLKKTSYLNACLMQRFFGHLRTRALEIIVKSHCPPNKTIKISLTYLAQTLKFDKADDCVKFCIDFGLLLNSDDASFSVSRNDFYLPEMMFTEKESSSLVVNKRIPVARGVLSNKDIPKVGRHEVHSSFTEDHFLKPGALDASDQEEKMLRDNVSRTIFKRKSVEEDDAVENKSSPVLHPEVLVSPVILSVDEEPIDIPEVDMSPDMPFDDDEEEIEQDPEVFNEEPIEDQESPRSEDRSTESSGHTSPSMVVTDDSDSDSYNTTDLESISGAESVSPLKQVTTPPFFTAKISHEQQKTPVPNKFTFSFPTDQSNFSKMSEPFKILSTQKSPETPEQKSFFKKPKTDPVRPSQKTKIENENNILMAKLKKKLVKK